MTRKFSSLLKWKPLKWWLVSLLALVLALWLSGGMLPVIASQGDQAVFKIGGDLVIKESQTVQDTFTIGGDLRLEKDVTVRGDAFVVGGTLQLEENVHVEGDAFAIGGQVLRGEATVVDGNEFTLLEQFSGIFDRFGVLGTLYLFNLVFWLVGFVVLAISGLLLFWLLPRHISAISTAIQIRPFASLVYGIGGLAAITIVTGLTVGSALGAMLIPLANLGLLFTSLLGGTAFCAWLGERLQPNHPTAHVRHFGIGLFLLFILSLIPFVGGFLISLITLFGFGATLLARYGTQYISELPTQLNQVEHQSE